jgi:hypothetical protein
VLVIDHTFRSGEWVEVALSVPFTYSQQLAYQVQLQQRVHPNLNYRQ